MKNILVPVIICIFCISATGQTTQSGNLEVIEYQIGKWLATEIRTDPDKRKYQFGYELQWFDSKKSIAKMTISGIYKDGEKKIYWEGFKHQDPEENKILYSGFSANGRIAKGYLEKVSENVINTLYSGIDPKGNPVNLKDIATKTDDMHYTSETYIKQKGQDWRKLNSDNWVKVESQKFNDQLK